VFNENENVTSEELEAREGVGTLDAENTEESAGEIHCGSDADIESSDIDDEAMDKAAEEEDAPAEECSEMPQEDKEQPRIRVKREREES
jgi:hypothetical protein